MVLSKKDSTVGEVPAYRPAVYSTGAVPRGTPPSEHDFVGVEEVLQLIAGVRVSDGLQTPCRGPRGSPRSGNHVLLEPQTALQIKAPAATPPGNWCGNWCYLPGGERS